MDGDIRDALLLVVRVALGGATLACTSLTQAPAPTAAVASFTPPRPMLAASATPTPI